MTLGAIAVALMIARPAVGALLPAGPTGPALPSNVVPALPSPPPAPPPPSLPVSTPRLPSAPQPRTPSVPSVPSTPRVPAAPRLPSVQAPSVPAAPAPRLPSGGRTPAPSPQPLRLPSGGGSGGGGGVVPTIGGGSSLLGGGGALGGGGILGGGGGGTLGGGGLAAFGGGTLGGGGSGFASSSGGPGAGTTPGGASALLLQAESGGGRGGGFGGSSISSQDLRAAVAQLAGCLGQLNSLERNVLVLRLGLDGGPMRSRGAVGRALGLSRGRMLSLERRGLHNLRGAASSSGCAAGATLISVSTFDPTTIAAFGHAPFGVAMHGGGNGSLQFGSGPARTAVATPIWGPGKGNSLPWTIAALATLGGLLLLAGAVFSGSLFPPLPAPVESRPEPARRRRPAVARSGRFDRTRRGPAPVRTGVRHRRSDDRE